MQPLCPPERRETAWWQSERNRMILIGRPPDTEIFSKRRKIYSFCVEGMSWCNDMNFHVDRQTASSKTVWNLGDITLPMITKS